MHHHQKWTEHFSFKSSLLCQKHPNKIIIIHSRLFTELMQDRMHKTRMVSFLKAACRRMLELNYIQSFIWAFILHRLALNLLGISMILTLKTLFSCVSAQLKLDPSLLSFIIKKRPKSDVFDIPISNITLYSDWYLRSFRTSISEGRKIFSQLILNLAHVGKISWWISNSVKSRQIKNLNTKLC